MPMKEYSPDYISQLIESAYERISPHVQTTRLLHNQEYNLFLKCENEQHTGSFKWRGALSKLSTISPGQIIVTASTGNHGLGTANAAKLYGLQAKIFVPHNAVKKKIDKIKSAGAEVVEVNGDSLGAELAGKKYAAENNLMWVSPYNDELVIAGQGTIGKELKDHLEGVEKIYITVGGGGLISGIASWLKHHHPHIEIIGCQPANSPEMYLSVLAGEVVEAPGSLDTLSDGSAGPLEPDSITYSICASLIDRFILIPESDIRNAIHHLYHHYNLVVEGAAGVAYAAAQNDPERNKAKSIVILCGGNIDESLFSSIVNSE